MHGNFSALNTVFVPYIRIHVWFWPALYIIVIHMVRWALNVQCVHAGSIIAQKWVQPKMLARLLQPLTSATTMTAKPTATTTTEAPRSNSNSPETFPGSQQQQQQQQQQAGVAHDRASAAPSSNEAFGWLSTCCTILAFVVTAGLITASVSLAVAIVAKGIAFATTSPSSSSGTYPAAPLLECAFQHTLLGCVTSQQLEIAHLKEQLAQQVRKVQVVVVCLY
jgi:hypothetical protein